MSSLHPVVLHGAHGRNTPLPSGAERSAVSNKTFSVVFNGVGGHILSLNPESALILQLVSRELKQISGDFLQFLKKNANEIVQRSSQNDSSLYRMIRENSIRFPIQNNRACLEFLFFIPKILRSAGIPGERCPNQILSLQEIDPFHDEVQNLQDVNLERIWGPIQQQLIGANPQPEGVPAQEASSGDIRPWMADEANKTALQGVQVLDLSLKELTSLPWEIRLLTGLQRIDLSNNQLFILPERAFFSLLTDLRNMNLSYNQLSTLPERAFYGLRALQALSLNNNQLVSLPERPFFGLSGLKFLELNNNRLGSLSKKVFRDLPWLRTLNLLSNRLTSLPAELFNGLNRLAMLSLQDNLLLTLPGGVFQGLVCLKHLDLNKNPLISLPEPIFHGLTRLQDLFLSDTELLPAFVDFPRRENHIKFQRMQKEFFDYPCISDFASFYQLVARSISDPREPFEILRAPFSRLPESIKTAIFHHVWGDAGHPNTPGPHWREHEVLDDMRVFCKALKKCVRDCGNGLSTRQQKRLHSEVTALHIRQVRTIEEIDFTDRHTADNILRLIDAMTVLGFWS